ncbi:hypothetical protein [Treponema sp.]|uniref:hypothetical protein n=1 Tax=Treponema sp. TaxID=166 RepID=UPI00298DF7A0|nr:hypothetical protein [Treponema sp.]MCR5614478.1 hypothetical protein [Treponema sp.]
MNDYKNYIEQLSWKNSEKEQSEAIEILSKSEDWDFTNCIRNSSKDIWENLVVVINRRSYQDKVKLADDLIYLLMDLNWPGALQGLEILKSLKKEVIQAPLEDTLYSAYVDRDGNWISNLFELIKYFKFSDSDFTKVKLADVVSLREW